MGWVAKPLRHGPRSQANRERTWLELFALVLNYCFDLFSGKRVAERRHAALRPSLSSGSIGIAVGLVVADGSASNPVDVVGLVRKSELSLFASERGPNPSFA